MTEESNDSKGKEFTEEYIKEQKNKFIEDYFVPDVKRFKNTDKRKKYVHSSISPNPNDKHFQKAMNYFYKKYWSFYRNWDEFISLVYQSIAKTVYENDYKKIKWDQINIEGTDSNRLLHSRVKTIYERDLHEYTDFLNKTKSHQTTKDKKKLNLTITYPYESTDIRISTDDEQSESMIELTGGKGNLYFQHDLYHKNSFLKWFIDNRKSILTKKQNEFMEIMPKYFHEEGSGYTKPYAQDEGQFYKCKNRNNYFLRIRRRATEKYNEEFPEGDKTTLLEVKKESDLQTLNELIHIVYHVEYDDTDDLNQAISNYIHEQLDNEYSKENTIISDLLHDKLKKNDLIHINTAIKNDFSINNNVIYKIVSLVENEIKKIEEFNTTVKHEKAASTAAGWTREEHRDYRDYLHAFRNELIKVYDLETGKLIRTEKYVPKSNNRITQRLDTYGIRHEVGELDIGID